MSTTYIQHTIMNKLKRQNNVTGKKIKPQKRTKEKEIQFYCGAIRNKIKVANFGFWVGVKALFQTLASLWDV